MKKVTRFINGKVLRNHTFKHEDVWIKEGKIIFPQEKAEEEIDVENSIIAPGFIDLQLNGGFGYDFSTHAEGIIKVANRLPALGVTSFLATVVTSEGQTYRHILPLLQPRKGETLGSEILGIHLEGPFISSHFNGAHASKFVLSNEMDWQRVIECYGDLKGVRLITLAPEIKGSLDVIEQLVQHNIKVAMGHSASSYDQGLQAIDSGASIVTHLFNAMAPFHHRQPGIIGSALSTPSIYYSLIADGVHLHPTVVDFIWRCHPQGLFLVSDATSALGESTCPLFLGNEAIVAEQGGSYLSKNKALAGTAIGLDEVVRRFKKFTNCSNVEALEAASLKPAQALGLKNKGSLNIGMDADLVILDENLMIKHCYVFGHKAF